MNSGLWLLYSLKNDFVIRKTNIVSFPWKNGTLHFSAPDYFHDNEQGLIIYMKGQIFTDEIDSFQSIKSRYLSKGIDFISELNGSFLILLIDSNKKIFYLGTDKLHSKKAFIQETPEFILITDSIFSQFKKDISIDESSLAQHLTSGFVFNSRTLISGIDLSKPATLYTFNGETLVEKKYWEITFNDEYKKLDFDTLKQNLYALLQKSIQRRAINCDALLSLSGGYDATAIQLLLNDICVNKPNCFSYYSGELTPHSDAWVANKQASLLNNPIEFIQAYDGNFENFIHQNAICGQGISNISFEISAWDYLQTHSSKPIFVGEEFFGMRDEKTNDFNEILSRQNFLNWSNIKNPEEFFNKEFIFSSTKKLHEDYQQITASVSKSENSSFDNQMILYYNYRLPNVLLSWREFFTGQKNPIQIPLLDDDIISFISKLPYWARNNKYLFKETLISNYPKLFKTIPRAKKSNNFNWEKIVFDNIKVIEKIYKEPSLLDQYINSSAITNLLEKRSQHRNYFYKLIKLINRKIKLPFTIQSKYFVPNYLLILRILVLKMFMSEFEKAQNRELK